jgi:hypothetical protein
VARKARWFAACAACLSLIAVVACGAGPGATTAGRPNGRFAEATRLVIIGGSIAAGDGLAPRATPRSCGRSEASFGNIIARAKHFRLIEVACASAKSGQIIHGQPNQPATQLELTANYVSNSIVVVGPFGGNDVGWMLEANTCLLHGCASLTDSQDVLLGSYHLVYDPNINEQVYRKHLSKLAANLKAIFGTLQREHPRKVLVDQYYAVTTQGESSCLYRHRAVTGATHEFGPADFAFLAGRLSARAFGFTVVAPDFGGHGVCAHDPWVAVRGFGNGAAMHPTYHGQRALAFANEAALQTTSPAIRPG